MRQAEISPIRPGSATFGEASCPGNMLTIIAIVTVILAG